MYFLRSILLFPGSPFFFFFLQFFFLLLFFIFHFMFYIAFVQFQYWFIYMNNLYYSIPVESFLIPFKCILYCFNSWSETFLQSNVCLETLKEIPFLWKEFQVKHHLHHFHKKKQKGPGQLKIDKKEALLKV